MTEDNLFIMFSKTNIEYWKDVGTKERKDGKKKEKKEGNSHTKKKKPKCALGDVWWDGKWELYLNQVLLEL